jgi:hypothetical protein
LGTHPPPPETRSREEAYLDAYAPLPPAPVPATGSSDPSHTTMAARDEPRIPGTIFLSVLLLMIIAAIWIVMYIFLLDR